MDTKRLVRFNCGLHFGCAHSDAEGARRNENDEIRMTNE